MRSRWGVSAAVVFLLAVPLAVLMDGVFSVDAEATLHLVCALGFALLAGAVFSFRTPRWLTWVGCLSAGAMAVIFLLQGISNLVPNDALHRIAFQILGQTPERVLPDLIVAWFVGLLLTDSRGWTRTLGWVVMALVVGVEVLGYASLLLGSSIFVVVPALKLALLLPFVWLLCESAKKLARGGGEPPLPGSLAAPA